MSVLLTHNSSLISNLISSTVPMTFGPSSPLPSSFSLLPLSGINVTESDSLKTVLRFALIMYSSVSLADGSGFASEMREPVAFLLLYCEKVLYLHLKCTKVRNVL